MINWSDFLIESIARRTCILYLGSGISSNSKNDAGKSPKIWRDFLTLGKKKFCNTSEEKKLIQNRINSSDYLFVCELLRQIGGRDAFNDLLKEEFQKPQFNVADIHKNIFKLDSRIVVTPNFDKIYDTYALSETKGSLVIKKYYDAGIVDCIRKTERLILKIHGSIDDPNNLIFSQVDYAIARNKHQEFYQLLNSLLLTQTFLFLGAGLNDPDIKLLLENYSFQYPKSRKHYFVFPKGKLSDMEIEIYSETLGLEFILYDPKNNHEELSISVADLVSKVEDRRNTMGRTQKW